MGVARFLYAPCKCVLVGLRIPTYSALAKHWSNDAHPVHMNIVPRFLFLILAHSCIHVALTGIPDKACGKPQDIGNYIRIRGSTGRTNSVMWLELRIFCSFQSFMARGAFRFSGPWAGKDGVLPFRIPVYAPL